MLSFPDVALKRITRIWLAIFAVSAPGTIILHAVRANSGCLGALTLALAILSCVVLISFGIAAAFRAIVRRLTLRLAFSYFLIGVVPIPLLAMLLFTAAYLFAHQVMATRVRREVTVIAQDMASRGKASSVRLNGETAESSDVPWVKPGDKLPWTKTLDTPRPVLEGHEIWIAMRRASDDPKTLAPG